MLTEEQIPAHTHEMANNAANVPVDATHPAGNYFGRVAGMNAYHNSAATGSTVGHALHTAGAGQPHENLDPYLVVNWIICVNGLFPSRS